MPYSPYDFSVVSPALRSKHWSARWAAHPDALAALHGSGAVFLFRKVITINAKPEKFVIHLSADQRYRFYVNGKSVCFGPARGDLMHWRFETIDIAPYLSEGDNILAARVHFFVGENAPVAQISSGFPALLVQGDTDSESQVNTPAGWHVTEDTAYAFTNEPARALRTYAVVGPSEIFDATKHPHAWKDKRFDATTWKEAIVLKSAAPFGTDNAETHWWLVPRMLPLMEETSMPLGTVRRSSAGSEQKTETPFQVPAGQTVTLLLDHGINTCGFPKLAASGTGTISLTYSEAPYEGEMQQYSQRKGNRNEIDGKFIRGYVDTWHVADDTVHILDTLWWRTFRYVEMKITAGDKPLTIHQTSANYTGYPWQHKAIFDAPEMPELAKFREVGWRTLRLCSHETYMDCPYYEQMQYAGDTRIQVLASLYETGDARLFKNALMQYDDSRASFGLTMSRYPARIPQVISPFSLWWVCMVEDYLQHVPDSEAFVRSLQPGVRSVLEWFADYLGEDDLLGPMPHWNFVDWCRSGVWHGGNPPGTREGGSSILTLQLALALQSAARMNKALKGSEDSWEKLADRAVAAVRKKCLNTQTMRIADTPAQETYSQHGNLLAILAGLPKDAQERDMMMAQTLTDPDTVTQATYYFRFYLGRALATTGRGDDYLNHLKPWHDMLALGLTTWAEEPDPTRSDCHAWSSSPNYEFLATVLGVMPGSLGWKTTTIAPHLGTLTEVSGAVPHPAGGVITVDYKTTGDNITAQITLPENGPGSEGTFLWRGQKFPLKSGMQTIAAKVS